jgi:YHS domain-containing protein
MIMAKDPVCGMMVDEKKAKFKSDYNGKTFYFCASSCKSTFDKDQAKYADVSGKPGHSCSCGGY